MLNPLFAGYDQSCKHSPLEIRPCLLYYNRRCNIGIFCSSPVDSLNVIIPPTSNQTLPTIMYNCITHCSSQQNAFMDGYKLGAIHATSGHFYDNNCNKDTHYCSVYQAGYATGWDRYIWAAEHTCYHCVNI